MDPEQYLEFFKKSMRLSKKLRKIARSNLYNISYTWIEFDIIRTIGHSGRIKLSELASLTGRQKSNIVPIINRFEEKGYVIRERDKEDRRNVWLVITKKGIEEKKRISEYQRKYIVDFLSEIDEKTIKEILENYDVVFDSLNNLLPKQENSK